eukprot:3843748-Rhodomonas_salina.1
MKCPLNGLGTEKAYGDTRLEALGNSWPGTPDYTPESNREDHNLSTVESDREDHNLSTVCTVDAIAVLTVCTVNAIASSSSD